MFVDAITSLMPGEKELRAADMLGIDVIGYDGEEMGKFRPIKVVDAKTQDEVKAAIEKWRRKVLLLGIRGNYEANRAAFHDSRIDVVVDPFVGRADLGLDHICLKKAEENNVGIAITFLNFIMLHKKDRVRYLRQLRRIVSLAEKYRVKVIMTSGAETWLDMRKPREMASLLIASGMSFENAMKAVGEWPSEIFEMNAEKLEGLRRGGVWIG